MSRRGWSLFILCGFLWGVPYLFIRIAVRDFSPSSIVFARVAIGSLILIPISLRHGTLRIALRGYKYIALYALTEIIGPWFLITRAETKIPSGLTGLLVATVPIWSTIFASLAGDKTVWHHKRLVGIVVGFIGVVALVGIESFSGKTDLESILAVLLASVGYGYAVNMISKKLPGVSGIAINAVAMAMATIVYAPFAIAQWPHGQVATSSILSMIALGILPTAMAFIVFFAIMDEIGAARASLVTYLNTAFAVLLGVLILSEPLTLGMAIGLPMVLIGSYLASRKPKSNINQI
jgi:drug/metabolite transporter (DMT)-like permease